MKKILLVDDNKVHLLIAEDVIKEKYEVITAISGKDALTHLSHGLVPNLIILDVLMPEMDGWETFKLIKGISLLRDVPIAFLTSLEDETDKDHAAGLGAADFITKSFKGEDLLKKIDDIIEKHESKNS